MRNLKLTVYRICRRLGLFWLAARWRRRKLLILCYHGFQVDDEARFRPQLFIDTGRFQQRLELMRRMGINVLTLSDALARMYDGELPDDSAVITIDDGFASVHGIAMPLLRQHGFPATVYVSTYYVAKSTPIFRLAVQYAFWKASERYADLTGVPWSAQSQIDLHDDQERNLAIERCMEYGEGACSEDERQKLLLELGRRLHVDTGQFSTTRQFSLMDTGELQALADSGLDIQLHTHRHNLSTEDETAAKREIRENRESLNSIVPGRYEHFCYPSGLWHERQWQWLEECGVQSATTCDPGLNDHRTPRYALRRFLDGDDIDEIEFLAEISGFAELARRIRRLLPSPHRRIGD